MKILASVTKKTQKGVSTWHFCQTGSTCFAINDDLKVIKCNDLVELRLILQVCQLWLLKVQPVAKPVKAQKEQAPA